MEIEILRSAVSDNAFYLIHDQGRAVLIDPIDPATALARVEALGVGVEAVVNTHWHPDHTGGNAAVVAATGASVLVPAGEAAMISGHDGVLSGGDRLTVGAASFEVLDTPGHTQGHISLWAPGHLICGDTIFVGGAGNCRFGGDPVVLYRTFSQGLAHVPDETQLYPGHDYAVRNLEFALHLDPDNEEVAARLAEVRAGTGGAPMTMSTLGQERRTSPFFAWGRPRLQARLQAHHPEAWAQGAGLDDEARTFVAVRFLRNSW